MASLSARFPSPALWWLIYGGTGALFPQQFKDALAVPTFHAQVERASRRIIVSPSCAGHDTRVGDTVPGTAFHRRERPFLIASVPVECRQLSDGPLAPIRFGPIRRVIELDAIFRNDLG
jgi:hypothetical protein